jgi:D-threo-aldose 1-dehydrogenase
MIALELGRVGLGTAPIGGLYEAVAEETAVATVARALERGLRLVDTAPFYGLGLSERRVGSVLAGRARDEYVLATKVGRLLRPAEHSDDRRLWPATESLASVFDYSFEGVLRSVDESLERLGLDRVDILHIHDADDHVEPALSGAYPALDRLRSEGAIAAVGAGLNRVEPLLRFAREADFDCFLIAGRYTLLDQSALAELLPLCRERGIAVILGGVLNSGLLAGGETFDYRPAPPEWRERARALREVCDRHGVPLPAAALQFPLAHPAVTTVLVGARSPAELDEDLDLLALPIPADLWSELRAEGLLPEDAPVP